MKIVHVISGLTKGGGERVVVELASVAVQHGDEVTLLVGWPEDPALLQNDVHPGVKIMFVSATKKSAHLKMFGWIFKNRKWLRGQDILHCHLTYGMFFGTAVKMIVRFFGSRKPLIIETNHAVGMRIPAINRWRNARMATMRDGFVLMARDAYWSKFIQTNHALPTAIIPNGIAPLADERSAAGRKALYDKLRIPTSVKYLIGTVGMLRPDRSPHLYIPVFKEIFKELGNDVHFIMAGAGPELEKIQSLAAAEGLSGSLSLPGLVNKPGDIIVNLDVYISVSVGETAGISMIEAAMCKLPVVAIQLTPGYKMKQEDWVWSDSDPVKLGQKIVQLVNDKEEHKALSEKQFAFVKNNFTAEAMYNAYNSFYYRVLNNSTK